MELEESWILLDRRAEEALARQKHHDEVGSRIELLPVRLRLECGDVLSHVPCEIGEALSPDLVVVCLDGVEERLNRRLCVDYHVPAAGQSHDEIRAQEPVV